MKPKDETVTLVLAVQKANELTNAMRDLREQINAHLAYASTHPEVEERIIKDFENTTAQIRDTIPFYQLTRRSQ